MMMMMRLRARWEQRKGTRSLVLWGIAVSAVTQANVFFVPA